ncbi:hypothetical protein MKX01_033006 [Papaver californicum]|nr:hypothetical protein MKX01_033006 [Papaver californicum]
MASSGDVVTKSGMINVEEPKLAASKESVIKAPPKHALLSICKSLVAGGVSNPSGADVGCGSFNIISSFLSSILILILSRTFVAPLDRLNFLLQVQNPHNTKYNGLIQGLTHIWNTEGFRGLYESNGTNCARIVPNCAVKFFTYEQASRGILWLYRQQPGNEDASLTPLLHLGAGACAGIIAMSATYPMDLVKGRLTVQTDMSPFQYRGIAHTLSKVLREEGLRGLYKGWLPSVVGVVPCIGLNFAVYALKEWLVETKPLGIVDNNSELSITSRLMCGAAAGTVGPTIFYPLDVIRRRMQMVGWHNASSVITGVGCGKAALEFTVGLVIPYGPTTRLSLI